MFSRPPLLSVPLLADLRSPLFLCFAAVQCSKLSVFGVSALNNTSIKHDSGNIYLKFLYDTSNFIIEYQPKFCGIEIKSFVSFSQFTRQSFQRCLKCSEQMALILEAKYV